MAFKLGMTVDWCMAYLISMTLTLMQGDSGSAKVKNQCWIISTTKQATSIEATAVGHVLPELYFENVYMACRTCCFLQTPSDVQKTGGESDRRGNGMWSPQNSCRWCTIMSLQRSSSETNPGIYISCDWDFWTPYCTKMQGHSIGPEELRWQKAVGLQARSDEDHRLYFRHPSTNLRQKSWERRRRRRIPCRMIQTAGN